MSSVDCVVNVNVGIVRDINIPIYWCLEDLEHDTNGDTITRNDLIIGGGSGEHPALLIKNANLLPLRLLKELIIDAYDSVRLYFNSDVFQLYNTKMVDKMAINIAETCETYDTYFFTSDWPLRTWLTTMNAMQRNGYSDTRFEEELLLAITKFVYQNMPVDFYDDDVFRTLVEHHDVISFALENMKDVLPIERLNRTNSAGKNIVNGQVVWGYSLDDYS